MLKLYNYPDCPFCQKVRVVLAEKDLEYEKVLVDLRKQDQKAPEFLQLNPYGKVPVLVDEDTVVIMASNDVRHSAEKQERGVLLIVFPPP